MLSSRRDTGDVDTRESQLGLLSIPSFPQVALTVTLFTITGSTVTEHVNVRSYPEYTVLMLGVCVIATLGIGSEKKILTVILWAMTDRWHFAVHETNFLDYNTHAHTHTCTCSTAYYIIIISFILTRQAHDTSILEVATVSCVSVIEAVQNRVFHSQALHVVQQDGPTPRSICAWCDACIKQKSFFVLHKGLVS